LISSERPRLFENKYQQRELTRESAETVIDDTVPVSDIFTSLQ